MKIFESHTHLDLPDFNPDRQDIIAKCRKNGIEYMINVGVDKSTIEASLRLADKYDFIYAAVGFHPHDAASYDREFVKAKARHQKVVAIGECGLDFYRNLSPVDLQKQVFADQIELAMELNLPLIIHDRDAHEECLEILSRYHPPQVVFHCFSGDVAFAERVLNKGWFISFTGVVTYKNSQLSDVVRIVPQDRFFIETDSPYLSPVPLRGKRNSPLNLRYVIEKISEIRGLPPVRIAQCSYENARQFFGINDQS
ncbi:MAG TPA: TatD family hydrolase [Candidatus Cloacimonadota bacterium]|nr:TatD family hydrolase [Candidatus Cloacimonadota bacterium]